MNKLLLNSTIPSRIDKIIDGDMPISELTGTFIFNYSPQGVRYWFNRALSDKPLSNTAKLHLKRIASFVRKNNGNFAQ